MNDHLWHCPCVSWMIHLAQLAFSEGGRWAKPFFICHTQKSPELLEYTYLPNPFTVLLDICCPWICVSFWACLYAFPYKLWWQSVAEVTSVCTVLLTPETHLLPESLVMSFDRQHGVSRSYAFSLFITLTALLFPIAFSPSPALFWMLSSLCSVCFGAFPDINA